MQRLIIALTVIIALLAAYAFWYNDNRDTATANTSAETTVSDAIRLEAREHIKSLTRQAAEDTLDMTQADHFVTGSQLLHVPAPTDSDSLAIETVDDMPATSFGVDIPGTVSADTKASDITFPGNRLRLKELLNHPDQAADEVFYIHSVQPSDQQGLWGIIHRGLIDTFTRGIRLEDRSRLLSADIPEDADEPLGDQRSSWLGHLLKRKVEQTWVFNHQQGLLGQNPDVIHPGQQLVIVRFSEEELIDIYNHFTRHDTP
ncbi:hypothetical protein [Marinobacterium weihaiense]|uniref:Uncharacterized protein n=1 Tax=Marinobacterium weihaiense TaxID=2851016 RepID=A0ABS6M951_9GAMM|nr:hypothetical protein [Marinobacterium weihaiense]MBV0932819.1 hypothetical protein [Marinobacterium weihaiense]